MRIRLGKKLLEFTDQELDYMYLNEGMEGTIYKYGDRALKIYEEFPRKSRLEENEALELSKISTNRILLPRELIYDDKDKFVGYSTLYIDSYGLGNISKMSIDSFIDEVNILYRDISILSRNNVDVDDYTLYNTLYNGGIYLVDPGSYQIVDNDERLFKDNRYRFNEFLVELLLPHSIKLTKREARILRNHMDLTEALSEIMHYEKFPRDTVRAYVKRITR